LHQAKIKHQKDLEAALGNVDLEEVFLIVTHAGVNHLTNLFSNTIKELLEEVVQDQLKKVGTGILSGIEQLTLKPAVTSTEEEIEFDLNTLEARILHTHSVEEIRTENEPKNSLKIKAPFIKNGRIRWNTPGFTQKEIIFFFVKQAEKE